MLIHMIKRSLPAPRAIPTAAPSGAPKSNGDSNPKPITPYLFQISYNRLFSNACSSSYFHFKNRFLKLSPRMITKNDDNIAPAADTMAINKGFTSITNPKGMAIHSQTILAAKSIIRASKFIITLTFSIYELLIKKEQG